MNRLILAGLAGIQFIVPAAGAAGESGWSLVDGWGAEVSETLTGVTGIALDARGRVYVAGGEGPAIVVLDPDGKEIDRWGDFIGAKHGLRIFGERVFVTDTDRHTVSVCTLDGRVLKTLGVPGEAGDDERRFNKPTDVAVADDGTVYIADGYGNSRIVCLSPEFDYRFEWGRAGSRPGEFTYPHNVVLLGESVYVADRENRRIQVFDRDGALLAVWTHVGKPFGLAAGSDGSLYVSHIVSPYGVAEHGVMRLSPEGDILESFGEEGRAPGQFLVPHSLALGPDARSLFVGEVSSSRVQKFERTGP
jgi:DNA-binding beta-propeller fold protein YncE